MATNTTPLIIKGYQIYHQAPLNNTTVGTPVSITTVNDKAEYAFANPDIINNNYYEIKSGSITFSIISSSECKGTITGTFTKGNTTTVIDGTATFDFLK